MFATRERRRRWPARRPLVLGRLVLGTIAISVIKHLFGRARTRRSRGCGDRCATCVTANGGKHGGRVADLCAQIASSPEFFSSVHHAIVIGRFFSVRLPTMESPAPLTTNHGRASRVLSTGARHINNGDVITWRGPERVIDFATAAGAMTPRPADRRCDQLEHRELSAQLAGIGRPGAWKRSVA